MAKVKFGRISAAVTLCVVCLFGCLLAGCQSSQPESSDESFAEEVVEPKFEHPFYVLLVGNDGRTGTVEIDKPMYSDGSARSDVMMLMRIDPIDYKVTLISIPRDTAATVNGSLAKINTSYQHGGIDELLDQVKQLTGVQADYYFDLGFVTFEQFIDALGGVTVNVPVDMSLQDIVSGDNISLTAGEQELDGAEALVLSRSRKLYDGYQDAVRQMQNRAIVAAGINQVVQNPDSAEAAVAALMGAAETNMTEEELSSLVSSFVENADSLTIYQASGPYVGDIDPTDNMWYTTRDEGTWAQVIAAADAGEDPSGIVANPELALL